MSLTSKTSSHALCIRGYVFLALRRMAYTCLSCLHKADARCQLVSWIARHKVLFLGVLNFSFRLLIPRYTFHRFLSTFLLAITASGSMFFSSSSKQFQLLDECWDCTCANTSFGMLGFRLTIAGITTCSLNLSCQHITFRHGDQVDIIGSLQLVQGSGSMHMIGQNILQL